MHNIWNPWHGCIKISEGCDNCYMYFLDKMRDADGRNIYRTKSKFNYPLQKDRKGNYKVKSGEMLNVCMTSDFFLKEADEWRIDAWDTMKIRSDVKFFLLTKRPQRVYECLPQNWDKGWENIFFNVTCENQARADERIPVLLNLPFKHKGIMCAPLIGGIEIEEYLSTGQIEQVLCGGENYDGARPCNYDWVKSLRKQCEKYSITFNFIETGTKFIKDNRMYNLPNKRIQSEMAFKSGISFAGKPINFILSDEFGGEIPEIILYKKFFCENCDNCGSKLTCNGCAKCGKCKI